MQITPAKVVFLFGAGASYQNESQESLNPPLGKDLYNALELYDHNLAEFIGEAARLNFKNLGFEAGMQSLFLSNSKFYNTLQRLLADYISLFISTEKSLYYRFFEIVKDHADKIVVSTLNYDLLIETAVEKTENLNLIYRNPPFYFVLAQKSLRLLKIHGSCNFLPNLLKNKVQGLTFGSNGSGDLSTDDINIVEHRNELISWLYNSDYSVAPIMSLYMENKPAKVCPEFVAEQQTMWKETISKAEECYIVGAAYNAADSHIWEAISAAKCKIIHIDPNPKQLKDWAIKNNLDYIHLCNSFSESLSLIDGRLN